MDDDELLIFIYGPFSLSLSSCPSRHCNSHQHSHQLYKYILFPSCLYSLSFYYSTGVISFTMSSRSEDSTHFRLVYSPLFTSIGNFFLHFPSLLNAVKWPKFIVCIEMEEKERVICERSWSNAQFTHARSRKIGGGLSSPAPFEYLD